MMRRVHGITLLLFSTAVLAFSQTSTYEFLRNDVGARAAALNGSFVSMTDDPTVIFYNPAALTTISQQRLSAGYFKHLLDVNAGHLAYATTFKQFHVAAGVVYINYGTLTKTDASANVLGEFGASELAFIAAAGMELNEVSSAGTAIKLISSSLGDYSSTAVAFDLGYLYRIPDQRITLGASIQNIGQQLKTYAGVTESLPLDIRIGITKQPEHLPVLLNLNFHRLQEKKDNFFDRFSAFTFGAEFLMSESLRLRLGYSNQMRKDLRLGTSVGMAGFSFGGGLLIKQYQVDYAFNSLGKIGGLHRFTVGMAL